MNDEKISVVVAVYNVEKYLEKCVCSIINQTYKNLQIILVDDGSTDSSLTVCKSFMEKDSRIEVIHKENGGLTSARKAGFDASCGNYIAFIDSDDYLEPDYISELYNSIISNNSDIAISGYYLEQGNTNINKELSHSKKIFEKADFTDELVLPGIYPLQTDETKIPNFLWLRLFKKSIITDACFVSERKVYTEDLFFNLAAYSNCNRVSIVDSCLYHYVENPKSLTHVYRDNKFEMESERLTRINDYIKENKIDDTYRFQMVVLRAIWECVENATRTNSYNEFSNDIKKLYDSSFIRNITIKEALPQASKSEKICYFCFKHKLVFAVYIFKKITNILKNL